MVGKGWGSVFLWSAFLAVGSGVDSSQDEEGIAGEMLGGGDVRVLALPEWEPEDLAEFEKNGRPRNLGGGLWPTEFFPLEPVLPGLRGDIEILDPNSLPKLSGGMEWEIPEAVRGAYFGGRPADGLVDPQRLVAEPYRGNLLRFLKYHVEESAMMTYVLVLGADQDLPEGVTTGELWQRWFPRGAGAIILYHAGKPNRTAIEFGREMARKAGRARLQSILDACVKDAAQTRDASAQLERFCVKYSIQAYWLERDLGKVGENVEEVVEEEPVVVMEGSWWSRNYWLVVVTLIGAGAIGVAVWWSVRRRVVLFPDFDMPMRLGGAFSGGSDAVVHFGRNAGFEEKPKVLE